MTPPTVAGRARVDRRTKDLAKRLQPGEVAIVDHEDLDRIAAESLVARKVAAVVNASSFISGRYPNVGPLLLAAAGIALVDQVGPEIMEAVREGQIVRVVGAEVVVDGAVVARGTSHDLASLEERFERAKGNMGEELERFAENTLEYLRRERHLVLEPPALPPLRVAIKGRHVLIVVRGADYKEDLAHLRGYIREVRPVVIGVDGGADALVDFGVDPDIIIGDFDSVSSRALRSGAQLVVHAYPGGRAPGAERLEGEGLDYDLFESGGTSEDIAMLLAYELGAELIVAVGTHASMVEFLDKGRAGMASTFLVRLKVGPILVDAKGVNRLYAQRPRPRELVLFLAAAALPFFVIVAVAFPTVFIDSAWLILRDAWRSLF